MPKPKPVKNAEASTADDLSISEAQKSWVILQEGQGSQLAHWLTLGRGLVAGRRKHPSNTAFSKWCMEAGFAFVSPDDRGDARWLAEQWDEIQDQIQPGHTHPHVIRAHLRKVNATHIAPQPAQTVASRIMSMRPQNGLALLETSAVTDAVGSDAIIRKGLKALKELRQAQAERGEDDYGPLRVHSNWSSIRCYFETLKRTDEDYDAMLGMLNAWSPEGVVRTERLRKASVHLEQLRDDLARVESVTTAAWADIASKALGESDFDEDWLDARNLLVDGLNESVNQGNEIVGLLVTARVEELAAQAEISACRIAPLTPMTDSILEDADAEETEASAMPASMAGKTVGELKAIIALHPNAILRADAHEALAAMGAT